ncbi:MAG: SEL1-like repeat protein [Flavobacteriaceae bacterium]|nr:SEL1-like repeat protein [Flavobacteriaceae bacterium]
MLLWLKNLFFKEKIITLSEVQVKLNLCASAHKEGKYHIAYTLANELAEEGNAQSQYNLAGYFENGLYVNKNREVALKFFKQSANNGFAPAIEKVKMIELNFDSYMRK